MASVNGVSIKSLKNFKGHEGEPCSQGNVYYQGKKLGFWSQSAHGGEDMFEGFGETIEDIAKEVAKTLPETYKYKEYFAADTLMNMVLDAMELEKEYKKYIKMGAKTLLAATDGYSRAQSGFRREFASEEEALEAHTKDIEELLKLVAKGAKVFAITSLGDLDIDTTKKFPCWLQ